MGLVQQHFDAVKARLAAAAELAGNVEDTARVTDAGEPIVASYVILFGSTPESLDDARLTGEQSTTSDADYVYTVRAVAPSATGAREGAEIAWSQLVGFKPSIAGRDCHKIRHVRSDPVEQDRTGLLFYCDDDYALRSTRS